MIKQVQNKPCQGTIVVPPSKSDSQRALLAAALDKGETVLVGVGESADETAMMLTIEQLGAVVVREGENRCIVHGIQQFPEAATLNAGESGLGVRLITSMCAAHKGCFHINGEGSLLERPQGFFEDHLTQLGVKVRSSGARLPLEVCGPMHGGKLEIDGSVSSQFLSGLLMALPLIQSDTELVVNNLKSIPYVRMTLDTLARFGVSITQTNFERFLIPGNQKYQCEAYRIESDWSSASYWLVAAALGQNITIHGLAMESYQADKVLLDALVGANCVVSQDEHGIRIDGNYRTAFSFDATHCPDLFPALTTLAAFCDGDSYIYGLHRLKSKESDRGLALEMEFEKLGLGITREEENDVLIVHGGVLLTSAKVDAHNDHRIAMCLGIAGLFIDGGVEVSGAEAVAKSYPQFWEDLERLQSE